MDKIIGLGNALIDVLATLKDDTLLDELELPKIGTKSTLSILRNKSGCHSRRKLFGGQ